MEYRVGDKVRVRINLVPSKRYGSLKFLDGSMSKCAGQICTIMEVLGDKKYYVSENPFAWSEEMLEPVAPTLAEIKEKKLTCVIHTPNKEDAICIVDEIPSSDSSTTRNEWLSYWDVYRENTCYKIIDGMINAYCDKHFYEERSYLIYEFSDLVVTGGYYNDFRGGKIPTPEKPVSIDIQPLELVCNKEQAKELAEKLNKELAGHFNAFSNNGISAKNGGKNSMKFTFYVKEGTRVDKSCNGTIPTMTTNIELSDGNVFDEITTIKGSATCDKADYDERQGVLEALANAVCGGEFEKRYKKAVKANKDADLWMRTCYYCGKVFDTVEEKVAHDDWHVECKKARRERYLLRKRAKEIAFEEQAQKMAKEMMGEQK